MNLNGCDVWGHFAPLYHLVDVFAVYAITLVGGRHVMLSTFTAQDTLLTIGEATCCTAFTGVWVYAAGYFASLQYSKFSSYGRTKVCTSAGMC